MAAENEAAQHANTAEKAPAAEEGEIFFLSADAIDRLSPAQAMVAWQEGKISPERALQCLTAALAARRAEAAQTIAAYKAHEASEEAHKDAIDRVMVAAGKREFTANGLVVQHVQHDAADCFSTSAILALLADLRRPRSPKPRLLRQQVAWLEARLADAIERLEAAQSVTQTRASTSVKRAPKARKKAA